MNCPFCDGYLNEFDENLLVCEGDCTSEFSLQYLGMYDGNDDERIDQGFEPTWWVKKYEKIRVEKDL